MYFHSIMERAGKSDAKKEIPSLKGKCLEFISSNLSRYTEAFYTTEDAELKGNLEYLRRFYSPFLIRKKWKQYVEDESYFEFLINEYLVELDYSIFSEWNWDEVLERTVEVGKAFKAVRIDEPGDSNGCLEFEEQLDFVHEVVRNIPNVETLEFYMYCNDQTLEIIAASCPKLKGLTIAGDSFSSKGLKSLCREMRNGTDEKGLSLRVLSLWCDDHCNEGVEFLLRNMPSLEEVQYTELVAVLYGMHKNDKNTTQRKYNLLSLQINPNRPEYIADMLAVITEVCPRVRNLLLPNPNADSLDLITRFSELEDLDIRGEGSHEADCSSFLECRGEGLRKLSLRKLKISPDTLMQCCPQLEILRFYDTTFKPLGRGSVLTRLYRLRELSMNDLNFEDSLTLQSVTAVLKSSANLRQLLFYYCKFQNLRTVTDLIKSCGSSSLRVLEFLDCGFGEAKLRAAFSACLDLEKTRLIVKNS